MKTSISTLFLGATLALTLLTLTACEDPSNIGIGLDDDLQGGRPVTAEAAITNLEAKDLVRPENVRSRALAGRVDDPAIGIISAEGYLDFTPISSADFRAGTVQSAELQLAPMYTYGDTAAELTFALRSVEEEWQNQELPVDTAFATGEIIQQFTFRPGDTLVAVTLPSSWVEENDALLRSSDFVNDFHGFRIDPVDGNAVVGFHPSLSALVAWTEEDSAAFPIGKAYSALSKEDASTLDNRVIVQAGVGPEARFDLALDEVAEASAINRASVTFRADTSLATNPNFHRPLIRTLDLYGVTEGGGVVLLARSNINDEGRFRFTSDLLARELQAALLGTRSYEQFELRIPAPNTTPNDLSELTLSSASISVVPIYIGGDQGPSALLTLTPIDG